MAQSFEDRLIGMVPTAEVRIKAAEVDAYTLGVSAYLWGYPLARMERVIREYSDVSEPQPATSYRAAPNQLGWATELATPSAKDMPAANNDTLYLSCALNLTEPFLLEVPDTADRYYVINVFTMYHQCEHYIGRRVTGTAAGVFAIVPPGWQGELADGVHRLDVSTPHIWLWGRLHVRDGERAESVQGLMDGFRLAPLSAYAGSSPDADHAPDEQEVFPPMPEIAGDPLGFFVHLGFALQSSPVPPQDAALFGQFERIGLTREGFDPSRLTAVQRAALERALDDAPAVAISSVGVTAEERQGWDWTAIDDYGFNYPLRSVHCGPYLGGNMVKEAHYPSTWLDSDGQLLTGAHCYRLDFEGEPPVDAFWSLTLYNGADKMLVENPLHRYKLGSESPSLIRNPDGTFTIFVQHEPPADEHLGNWLPSPVGDTMLVFRFYQPRPELLDGSYRLPYVRRI